MSDNNPDKNNNIVTDWFKVMPNQKAVGNLFGWNVLGNVIVGAGAYYLGDADGQVATNSLNAGRAGSQFTFEKFIAEKINPAVASTVRTGLMGFAFISNLGQIVDPTTEFSRYSGILAATSYLYLTVASLIIKDKKKTTISLSERAFQEQINLKDLQGTAANNNDNEGNDLKETIREKHGHINVISDISNKREKSITALYLGKKATGYTLTGRGGTQIASGVQMILTGDFISGACEIVGGSIFLNGALRYKKKESQEYKERKFRLAKRKILHKLNEPDRWDKNGASKPENKERFKL